MPELVPNRFPATVAYDTNTGNTLKNAGADVYAVTDTSFTTPLPLKDMSGVTMAKLVSSNDGIFPPFVIDGVTEYAEVVAKSGSFVTPLVSFVGGSGPQGEPGPPGAGVPDTAVAQPGQVPQWNGSAVVWATPSAGGGSGISGAPASWPNTFPPSGHSHAASDITNSSAVGRAVVTAVDAQAARAAIGAGTGNGTSNLTLGGAATQAMPGNRVFNATEVQYTPSGTITATTVAGAIAQAAATGGSGSAVANVAYVDYRSGGYPALPASKPAGIQEYVFRGPVAPTTANVSGGLPSYLGADVAQIPASYEYWPFT